MHILLANWLKDRETQMASNAFRIIQQNSSWIQTFLQCSDTRRRWLGDRNRKGNRPAKISQQQLPNVFLWKTYETQPSLEYLPKTGRLPYTKAEGSLVVEIH